MSRYVIRELRHEEFPLLKEFLYQAIFQRDNEKPLPKTIIEKPELQRYIQGFGSDNSDCCLCAEACGNVIGAVWVRNIEGYGSIDIESPEFAISLFPEFRGRGIGTALMAEMLGELKKRGYSKASLAVQKDNYAVRMYRNLGFQIIEENEEEYIMIYEFDKKVSRKYI